MSIGTVFVDDGEQLVRLPADACFSDEVKQVAVRVVGKDLVLSPVNSVWDNFFLSGDCVSDDFMEERASQKQPDQTDHWC